VTTGEYRNVQIELIEAVEIDERLTRQLAVLLGRAYTDQRHMEGFSEGRRGELAPHVLRVHSAGPESGELMPQSFLENFPTLRNLARPEDRRRESVHALARTEDYVATHVSLWPQFFRCGDATAGGGYMEDVATDPLDLRRGLATAAMEAAAARAEGQGLDVLGLATSLEGFYERLGWRRWAGGHTFHVDDFGLAYPDEPLFILPLSLAGRRLAAEVGQMHSWRLWRYGETPGPPNP
jgi:GNAT superfamily N-acetyltransferase